MALNLERISSTVERYMLDTVHVERKTGTVMDPETLQLTEQWETVWLGKGFLSPMGSPAKTEYSGEDVQRTQYELGIPASAPQLKPNDRVTMVESRDHSFTEEERLFIRDQIVGTFFTHRRAAVSLDRTDIEP